jgi:phenylacetate-coenzyme A ligase PaaK-like adenylate-forming protein
MTAVHCAATDLTREREEQRRWRLRPRFAKVTAFDQLLDGEFLSQDEQSCRQSRALSRVIDFAAAEVPYYRDLFAARGLEPKDIQCPDDLAKLPLLDKEQVRANSERLRSARLPRGERLHGVFSSSGTTGQPVKIIQTSSSNAMFTYLIQRNYRWCRFDPGKTIAFLRIPGDFPSSRGGGALPDGVTYSLPRWRYAGAFFETGPWLSLTMTTPVERQIEWLRARHPAYLCTHASWLEQLCYAAAGETLADSLESILGISEDLRPPARRFVERTLGVPVHQNYGMNEIGLMAMRCVAGRYHVHAEHCLIEIVDTDGRACPPGVTGRIAVTALRNPAMPLIRYDTDDMAEAVDGPCPCGRSLPSFVNLVGRYRRYVSMPEGSYELFLALRTAVNDLPGDTVRALRRFQVHQYRDGRFELRLLAAGPLPPAFHDGVRAAWDKAIGTRPETLGIVEVDEIPRGAGGKFQDFTSDFMPAPDPETAPST